jgi:predicted MFS family arabinose efflux permease
VSRRAAAPTLAALALLYTAQGVPFGFAAEYLPVVLRKAHYSLGFIAAVGWLQLPWQLKILWSPIADARAIRKRSRGILLALQLLLTGTLALYALRPLTEAPHLWFVLTAVAALFAATQDIFVDALAVRSLAEKDRGLGNTAQVAGYRVGILVGGAGLLLLVSDLGLRGAVLSCASLVGVASLGAFFLHDEHHDADGPASAKSERGAVRSLFAFAKHLVGRDVWPVAALALTFKLGIHMAAVLIKPMLVDAHWSERSIGLVAVTFGITGALVGAAVGGLLHRFMREGRALLLGAILHAVVCVPLLLALVGGLPRALTTVAIVGENFVSGLGTTVLFAALMSATRKENAALHYTLLTSMNALAIGIGGTLGGVLADRVGKAGVFGIATVVCLAPLALLPRWTRAAAASATIRA